MGLPALLCIVADNQEGAVGALGRDGVFQSLGRLRNRTEEDIREKLGELILDKKMRSAMHEKGRSIVDGKGTGRGAEAIRISHPEILRKDIDFGDVKFVNLINLTDEEKEMVRSWRNSEEIRKWMFTDHIISKGEHFHFIEGLKKDIRNLYWIVEKDALPIGVL